MRAKWLMCWLKITVVSGVITARTRPSDSRPRFHSFITMSFPQNIFSAYIMYIKWKIIKPCSSLDDLCRPHSFQKPCKCSFFNNWPDFCKSLGLKEGFVWPWATSPVIADLDFTPCLYLYFLSLQCSPLKAHFISWLYFVPLSVIPFPPKLSRPFIYGLLHFLHTSVRAYAIVFVSFTCLFLPVNSKRVHVVEHVFIHLCMPRSSIYAFVWAGGVKNRQGGCFGASKPPEI